MTDNTNTASSAPKAAQGKPAPKAEPKAKGGEPKSYTSTTPTYVGGELVPAGKVFVTSAPKGYDWDEVTQKEAAAIQVSTDRVPDDANLEEATKSALQAVAIIKHVNITGLDKPGLIDAIKAAYEPKL